MRTLLLTGFGAFERVEDNPSAALARRLIASPPTGLRIVGGVLPVSFRRVPAAFDRLLESEAPELLVALGVHRGDFLRLETRAGGEERDGARPDVDGETAARAWPPGPALASTLDLGEILSRLVRESGVDVRLSSDAGGYVCERTYAHLLGRARELGVPGLFVHVPPVGALDLDTQAEFLERLLLALLPPHAGSG